MYTAYDIIMILVTAGLLGILFAIAFDFYHRRPTLRLNARIEKAAYDITVLSAQIEQLKQIINGRKAPTGSTLVWGTVDGIPRDFNSKGKWWHGKSVNEIIEEAEKQKEIREKYAEMIVEIRRGEKTLLNSNRDLKYQLTMLTEKHEVLNDRFIHANELVRQYAEQIDGVKAAHDDNVALFTAFVLETKRALMLLHKSLHVTNIRSNIRAAYLILFNILNERGEFIVRNGELIDLRNESPKEKAK